MAGRRFVRIADASGTVRVGVIDGDKVVVLPTDDVLGALKRDQLGAPAARIELDDVETCRPPKPWTLLVPIVAPETWAAGVTYERSRAARVHESKVADVYDLVYDAERPELFLKDAAGRRTVGPGQPIAARSDASWTVPEPELAVVIDEHGTPLAVTIGNDVSSRDIEGANPLYLPQAKIYSGACALGPALLVPADWNTPFEIELRILHRDGHVVFTGQTSTARMRRRIPELIDYLRRDNPLPGGTVLLTGTGVVPPDDVTLEPGHEVEIRIAGIGTLRNPVTETTAQQEATVHV
jgi:2-dehydro-3-deoxy-D-arabinonate dehydratase